MNQTLDSRISNRFRSKGERAIASLLREYRIPFYYEPDIYLIDGSKRYIWHPDFYLPEQQTIIEYFGVNGDPHYDNCTQRKKRIYQQNHYNLIPVYPETLTKNYKAYITTNIQTYLSTRAKDFARRIGYASKHR